MNTESRRGRQIAAVGTSVLASFFISLFALSVTGQNCVAQSAQAAKKDYALIYGTVWGPDDHPVAGIPIKIRRASDKKGQVGAGV